MKQGNVGLPKDVQQRGEGGLRSSWPTAAYDKDYVSEHSSDQWQQVEGDIPSQ